MTSSRRLRLAPQAERDLRAIVQYTAQTWDTDQSDAYAAVLQEATRRLAGFPAVGRAREEIGPDIRSYSVRQHLILYRIDPDALVVLRVLHARMDVRRALDDSGGQNDE